IMARMIPKLSKTKSSRAQACARASRRTFNSLLDAMRAYLGKLPAMRPLNQHQPNEGMRRVAVGVDRLRVCPFMILPAAFAIAATGFPNQPVLKAVTRERCCDKSQSARAQRPATPTCRRLASKTKAERPQECEQGSHLVPRRQ